MGTKAMRSFERLEMILRAASSKEIPGGIGTQ